MRKNNSNWIQKCICAGNIPYFVSIIGIIIVCVSGIFLYKRLDNVKEQLESCRSSRISN